MSINRTKRQSTREPSSNLSTPTNNINKNIISINIRESFIQGNEMLEPKFADMSITNKEPDDKNKENSNKNKDKECQINKENMWVNIIIIITIILNINNEIFNKS